MPLVFVARLFLPPSPAPGGPKSSCSPLECLHFHPDHVPYPYPNANPSTSQNPNPRSMLTVYVYLDVHTHIHTHVDRAHSGNTSDRQTLARPPFSLPVAPFPASDWTGTCFIQSWDTRRHITLTTPVTFLCCVSSHGGASSRTNKNKTKTRTRTTGNRTTATFGATIRTSLGTATISRPRPCPSQSDSHNCYLFLSTPSIPRLTEEPTYLSTWRATLLAPSRLRDIAI